MDSPGRRFGPFVGLFEGLEVDGLEDGTEVVGPFVGLFEGLDVDGLAEGTEVVGPLWAFRRA